MVEAVEGQGHTRREVADFLGLHFTPVRGIRHPEIGGNNVKRSVLFGYQESRADLTSLHMDSFEM